MQIVNGYVCMNCCDVDKARLGQDPHQSTDQIQKQINLQLKPLAPDNFGPAVSFGGSLQAVLSGHGAGNNTTASAEEAGNGAPSVLNLLA